MLNKSTSRKFIPPRRQGRKETISFDFSELGVPFDVAQDMLCVFARVIFFRFHNLKTTEISNMFG
jgi:hypothetical protein